jgi:hypothetical protein
VVHHASSLKHLNFMIAFGGKSGQLKSPKYFLLRLFEPVLGGQDGVIKQQSLMSDRQISTLTLP